MLIMKSGIYRIRNLINNKFYIGSSNNINHRKSTHLYDLRNQKHRNIHLQRSYNKHKEENFLFDIIELCEVENLILREQHYIDTLKPEYNISLIAGSTISIKRPNQSIRIIEANKNRIVSQQTKKRVSNTLKQIGHKPSRKCIEESMKILRKPVIQLDLDGNFIREFNSIAEACKELELATGNLSKVCKDKIRSLKGFKWKYKK